MGFVDELRSYQRIKDNDSFNAIYHRFQYIILNLSRSWSNDSDIKTLYNSEDLKNIFMQKLSDCINAFELTEESNDESDIKIFSSMFMVCAKRKALDLKWELTRPLRKPRTGKVFEIYRSEPNGKEYYIDIEDKKGDQSIYIEIEDLIRNIVSEIGGNEELIIKIVRMKFSGYRDRAILKFNLIKQSELTKINRCIKRKISENAL